ncbi:hypothetical protein BACUNI_01738 [Bacteroides uniformis ATCC 8492]|uniref:Uncharacterized protein n=1 Tax=Bacteroides uniformis (strain ATCC 8492 / DSM 6597 / CCUG 4942 / CIP 103695 / JCM 5828 / KCTC 5204 / NCTC 13054 / VPI 0061) TaxID=411479 RepID=A0ABC9NDA1_BACUC|nr:hypothetical protein BACUNI_01738 [Bacteroides uniformis ATCC 8492]
MVYVALRLLFSFCAQSRKKPFFAPCIEQMRAFLLIPL